MAGLAPLLWELFWNASLLCGEGMAFGTWPRTEVTVLSRQSSPRPSLRIPFSLGCFFSAVSFWHEQNWNSVPCKAARGLRANLKLPFACYCPSDWRLRAQP